MCQVFKLLCTACVHLLTLPAGPLPPLLLPCLLLQVVGDAIQPHLESLSDSQSKLLAIYCERARSNQLA